MDAHNSNSIATILEATGLPSEIWPLIPPSGDGTVLYSLGSSSQDDGIAKLPSHYHRIQLHDRTISVLQSLSAAHVLGQGVLVRAESNFTAMVSIAEAAYVLLGNVRSSLLWVLLEFIERELRAHTGNEQHQCSFVKRKKEISFEEHIEKIRRREDHYGMWRMERDLRRNNLSPGIEDEMWIDQMAQIKLQQSTFGEKLHDIQKQNMEILQLLKGISQGSNEVDTTLPFRLKEDGDTVSGPVHLRYYEDENNFPLYLRKEDKKFSLWTSHLESKTTLADLADWIEVALGGRDFMASSSILSKCIRLEDDNQLFLEEGIHPSKNSKEAQTCWRKKILSGNILGQSIATTTSGKTTSGILHSTQVFSHPFSQCRDGLVLTAAALWSIFDNAVKRISHCNCTFTTESGDFIQCKSKSGKWYLWHTFRDEEPCDGQQCEFNVCVALTTTEPGDRIYTTSPCVLGWAAQSRTKPNSPLWSTLKVSAEFRKKTFTKYEVKEFQAQAQLSIPAVVTPQICGAITFAKRCYEVANSIDHASNLATEMAAATVVLIFDERRGLHFACDGADIIEMLCLQYLGEMGNNTTHLAPFTHQSALQRLHTWSYTSFMSLTGTDITGDYLVREASKKVSQLVKFTKNAAGKDKALLYWLLEDVLKGNVGQALKAPRTEHISWHELALEYPPLIFAVGDIDEKLITATGFSLKLTTPDSKSITFSKTISKLKKSAISYVHGGIVGSHGEVE